MNKTELVETISQRTDIAKKDVQAVLDTFEDIAGEIVAKGKDLNASVTISKEDLDKINESLKGMMGGM